MDEVKQRLVGVSGLRVSEIGLGTATWGAVTDATEAGSILDRFLGAGGTLIDSSPAYAQGRAERVLGQVLNGGVDRSSIILTSASGVDPHSPVGRRVDCSRRRLMLQLDTTLANLGTDHLDVWSVGYWDERTPPAEVADTLDWAVRTGRTRYAGVRGYAGWQLAVTSTAVAPGRALVAAQNEYSLLVRDTEEELLPAARHLGVGMFAAAPLAQGVLTGRYRSGMPPGARTEAQTYLGTKAHTVVEALSTAADGLDLSPAVVALAWIRDRPGVSSAIVGASTADQLTQLLAVTDTTLPRAIGKALDDVSR